MEIKKYFLLITIFVISLGFAIQGDAGQEIALLEIGAGARAHGLGAAYVAHKPDATSLYWNPAGLAYISQNEISTMQNKLATEASYYYLGGVFPAKDFTWGINWLQLELPDLQETAASLNNNEVEILNTFSYHATALIIGGGAKLNENLALGLNAKLVSKKLSDGYGQSSGQSFGIGLLYKVSPQLSLGLKADNLGSIQKYDTGYAETIPPKYTAGLQLNILPQLNFLLDVEKNSNKNSLAKGHGGFEYLFNNNLYFSLGCDYKTITAGAGFSVKNVYADYAYRTDNTYNLGAEHFVTLGVRW